MRLLVHVEEFRAPCLGFLIYDLKGVGLLGILEVISKSPTACLGSRLYIFKRFGILGFQHIGAVNILPGSWHTTAGQKFATRALTQHMRHWKPLFPVDSSHKIPQALRRELYSNSIIFIPGN